MNKLHFFKLKAIYFFCIFFVFLCLSCNTDFNSDNISISYEEQFAKCMENVQVREFIISKDGRKGFGYSNTNPDCLLGALLPKFEIVDIKGNVINTESIKGKINIINFWFIKCKPCINEIPTLNSLVKKYDEADINFLAFTLDDQKSLETFLKEHPFYFKVVPNSKNIINQKFHMIYGYPFTMITDRKNRIIGTLSKSNTKLVVSKVDSLVNSLM